MQHITDDSDLRKYRIETPNLIDDLGLDPYQRALYHHYKRVCGGNGGRCTESVRTTAKRTQMSVGKIPSTREQLADLGLIRSEISRHGTSVAIADIWPVNFAYYSRKDRPDIQGWTIQRVKDWVDGVHLMNTSGCSSGERSPGEHPVHTVNADIENCSPGEQGCSPGEPKKEPFKNQRSKNQQVRKNGIDSQTHELHARENDLDPDRLWSNFLDSIRLQTTQAVFDAVFKPSILAGFAWNGDDGRYHATITARNKAALGHLSHKWRGRIENGLAAQAGGPAVVEFMEPP